MNATFTDQGIQTPLGILSLAQVHRGEKLLAEAEKLYTAATVNRAALVQASSAYWTAIPHKFGRNQPPVLDRDELFIAEKELLELLADCVKLGSVDAAVERKRKAGEAAPSKKKKAAAAVPAKKNVFASTDVREQYLALNTTIGHVAPGSAEHKAVLEQIEASQKSSHNNPARIAGQVVNVFSIRRDEEHARFRKDIANQRRLYHGSRPANWVGLLSRGILLPKVVTQLGVKRTDAGWLGSGIYFGEADTAAGYAQTGKRSSRFMLAANVALGKQKEFNKITYGLSAPPSGFDSNWGKPGNGSGFYDNEYVVYENDRHTLSYLIEMKS